MLIFRRLKGGMFVACDTEAGTAEIAAADSYWAKQARTQPERAARVLLTHTRQPNLTTPRGRKIARRNAMIISQLLAPEKTSA